MGAINHLHLEYVFDGLWHSVSNINANRCSFYFNKLDSVGNPYM